MKKKIFTVVLVILCLVAILTIRNTRQVLYGEWQKDESCYRLSCTRMNGSDGHALTLSAGDSLAIDFSVASGKVDLKITGPGDSVLYRGDEITTGSFSLPIEYSGDYTVTVIARHAAGYINVCRQADPRDTSLD